MTEEEVLNGGREIEVPLQNGTKQAVFIKEIAAVKFKEYANALNSQDLAKEIFMYSGIKADQLKTLPQAAVRMIRDEGREVNTDFLEMIMEDQNPTMAPMMKKLKAELGSVKNELASSLSGLLETEMADSENANSELTDTQN